MRVGERRAGLLALQRRDARHPRQRAAPARGRSPGPNPNLNLLTRTRTPSPSDSPNPNQADHLGVPVERVRLRLGSEAPLDGARTAEEVQLFRRASEVVVEVD